MQLENPNLLKFTYSFLKVQHSFCVTAIKSWLGYLLFCKMHAMCFISVVRTALSDVSASPHDDRSLMVRWRSVLSSYLKGFIVEWRPSLNPDISLTQFEITDSNQTSLILKGMVYVVLCIFIQISRRKKENI